MDAKEIKACLKAAREAIRNKDFKEAIKQCKAVLAVEKNNYNALVFVGVAAEGMDQPDQALKAYRRAAEEQPEQLLAWQGLSTMLEKNSNLLDKEETISVYQKLVSLNSKDPVKQVPFLHKLAEIFIKSSDLEKALDTFASLLVIETQGEGRIKSQQSVISLLSPLAPKLSEEKLLMYKKTLNEVLEFPASLTNDEINEYTYFLLLLSSQTDLDNLPKLCDSLRQKFPSAVAPVEFLLRYYLDQNIGEQNPRSDTCEKIQELTAQLVELQGDCSIIKVGQSFTALQNKNFVQAQEMLQDTSMACISGQWYLSQACLSLHMFSSCLAACEKGLAICMSSKRIVCAPCAHAIASFQLAHAEALAEIDTSDSQDNALGILEEVQEKKPNEAFLIKAYIYMNQGKLEEAKSCASYLPPDALPVQTLLAAIHCKKKDYTTALKILQEVVEKDPNDARATLKLGVTLWELRNSSEIENAKQQCFTTFLKAAKLDPYNYKAFLYLGYFYKQIQDDPVKARRCFQKAYDLRPDAEDPGCSLVDTLVELGEESQSLKILETVTSHAAAGSAKWAWLRLGLYQIKHEEPTTAIASLQSALRADPNDNHVWECLAEAYLQRGSLTASLKAFTKASELDPESFYCLYQIASIKQTLGSLSEAIEEYKHILGKSDSFVPVLKGIGESLIQLGKQNLSSCLDGLAQDNFEEAISYLTKAASQRPDMSCLWKLLGDACTFTFCLASDVYRVPSKLSGKSVQDHEVKQVNKMELQQVGARCYSQALKILPKSGSLWQDLSVNLYYQSQLIKKNTKLEDGTEGRALLLKASQAIKKAIDMEPKNWRHWNALGVIACCEEEHKPTLAQHCFIKSIECEASNVVAWTNLGTLYLSKSEIQLAHDAFKAAQSVDPTYMACWIGQALIAEIVGHEEAMDLFRHTTDLGFHPEGALGYGQWVLSVLKNDTKRDTEYFQYCIQQMAAVPAASDALTRYTNRIKTDPIAYNMQGLLFEQQKLYKSAVTAFQNALMLLEEQDHSDFINAVRMNLARVLCEQQAYPESVKQFEQCDLKSDVEHTCIHGLALFGSGQLVKSFKVYEHALQLLGDDPAMSQIHTALGMVAFKLGDMAGAKSQLFDGFQTAHPSPNGLLALCALGLLQPDMTLVTAVLEELLKREDMENYVKDITLLQMCKSVLEDNKEAGEAQLRETVQAFPSSSALWSLLATWILHTSKDKGAAAADCAVTAIKLGGECSGSKERLLQSLGQLLGGHHSRQHSDGNALRAAQKAFHANPGCPSNLSALTCAVHAEALLRKALTGRTNLFAVEKGLLDNLLRQDLSQELKTWCLQQLIINSIENKDFNSAKDFLKQLQENTTLSPNAESFAKSISLYLSSQIDETAINDISDHLSLLVCCAICHHKKDFEHATTLLQQFANLDDVKTSPESLQHVMERTAYSCHIGLLEQPDNDKLKVTLEEIAKIFKEKEIPSPIVHLIQAFRAMEDNPRLSKYHFATALDQVDESKEIGHCSSVIRQGLMVLLKDSTKDSDQKLIQALLEDAKAKGDHQASEVYAKLGGAK